MQPDWWIECLKVIVLGKILTKAPLHLWHSYVVSISLGHKAFIINPFRLLIELCALKPFSGQIILPGHWVVKLHILSIQVVKLVEEDVVLIKVSIIAPLCPPFRINNIPFQLVGRTLDDHLLLVLKSTIQNHFGAFLVACIYSETFQNNIALILWPDLFAEASTVHLLSQSRWNSMCNFRIDIIRVHGDLFKLILCENIFFLDAALAFAPLLKHKGLQIQGDSAWVLIHRGVISKAVVDIVHETHARARW